MVPSLALQAFIAYRALGRVGAFDQRGLAEISGLLPLREHDVGRLRPIQDDLRFCAAQHVSQRFEVEAVHRQRA